MSEGGFSGATSEDIRATGSQASEVRSRWLWRRKEKSILGGNWVTIANVTTLNQVSTTFSVNMFFLKTV